MFIQRDSLHEYCSGCKDHATVCVLGGSRSGVSAVHPQFLGPWCTHALCDPSRASAAVRLSHHLLPVEHPCSGAQVPPQNSVHSGAVYTVTVTKLFIIIIIVTRSQMTSCMVKLFLLPCLAYIYADCLGFVCPSVPEIAKVHCWPSCEVNGQILVWFHCDGEAPQWTVPEQQEITKGEWVYRGRTEHFINAHIQDIPENGADIFHLAHLHTPGFVSGADLRYTNSKTWEFLQHDWKIQWEAESTPNKHCCQTVMKHALTMFGRHWPLFDLHVVARQVGPGVLFVLFNHSFLGRGVIMFSRTPVEPLLQCVSQTIFYQSNIPPLVPKFLLIVDCIQFERDVMIWNNKKYVSKPILVKEDSAIQKHRRWFSQFYSENSPRLQYQCDVLDF
uniref:3-ketosteroid-9-alpha-monooxygenase oxygenase component-like C-terminal domain-containing protein n=1 Tax=Monopterus albus TaxID=43700 RepID=A0A3Q3ILA7_MONAL